MNAEIKGTNLIITIPLCNPPKETAKMQLIANSGGFAGTNLTHEGHSIKINVMAGYSK